MLDCRGMACPQPVLSTKQQLEQDRPERIEVLVDNQAASVNVSRFLTTQGYKAEVRETGGEFLVSGELDPSAAPVADAPPAEAYACAVDQRRTLVFVRCQFLGRGDDGLGGGLMKNFIATLKEMGPELWRIVLVNSGVRLTVEGSPALDALKELVTSGVSLLVCGTCLDHFGLLDAKQVGETTNMLDIVTSLQVADKVITV